MAAKFEVTYENIAVKSDSTVSEIYFPIKTRYLPFSTNLFSLFL
jgi:hypothetical protein